MKQKHKNFLAEKSLIKQCKNFILNLIIAVIWLVKSLMKYFIKIFK